MSLPISSLTLIAKTSIGATHYLPLADGTAANYKLLIQDLFPNFNTIGTSSELLYVNITNKNTLNFKGIKSFDNLLSVSTVSNNIVLQVNPANIDLSLCDNTTSGFITGPVSLTSGISGTLPVANGGTGLTTLTANSLFVGNGTSALTALGAATNGQIPIGRTGLSPVLANITAGTGRVFIGSSTPTAFYNADLNVNNSIALNGSTIQYISMGSVTTPNWLIIEGADALGLNTAGGNVAINAGDATGTGSGGTTYIAGGASTASTGFGGGVTLNGGGSLNGNAGTININAGQATGTGAGGSIVLKPGTSTSGTGGIVSQEASSNTRAFTNFVGFSGAASANSISSSTASASAKFGAIKIQINGVDKWIRVYDTAE